MSDFLMSGIVLTDDLLNQFNAHDRAQLLKQQSVKFPGHLPYDKIDRLTLTSKGVAKLCHLCYMAGRNSCALRSINSTKG